MKAWGEIREPHSPTGILSPSQLLVSPDYDLAVHVNGTVEAWGNRQDDLDGNQIPNPVIDDLHSEISPPQAVQNYIGSPNRELCAGFAHGATHALALQKSGSVLVWGGTTAQPQHTWSFIAVAAAGDNQSLGLTADGNVVHWTDSFEEVLRGPGATVASPVTTGALAIAAGATASGGAHFLILGRDGAVRAWHVNSGTSAAAPDSSVPASVGSGVKKIAAGLDFSVAP